jgi:hypothetical protein
VPSALPEGWQIYKTGNISIGIASGWTKYDPGYTMPGGNKENVWLSPPNNAILVVAANEACVCMLGCSGGNGGKGAKEMGLWIDYRTNALSHKRFTGTPEYFKVGRPVRQGWWVGWMIMGKMISSNQVVLKL